MFIIVYLLTLVIFLGFRLKNLLVDKSANFMGKRSNRFAMIVENNIVLKIFIEKPGAFNVSSAEKILENL